MLVAPQERPTDRRAAAGGARRRAVIASLSTSRMLAPSIAPGDRHEPRSSWMITTVRLAITAALAVGALGAAAHAQASGPSLADLRQKASRAGTPGWAM